MFFSRAKNLGTFKNTKKQKSQKNPKKMPEVFTPSIVKGVIVHRQR
jgi:hypothetical protein